MATFEITITRPVARDLRRIVPQVRLRILRSIQTLKEAPLPRGSAITRIRGIRPPLYRLQTGDYRVLYRIEDREILVLAVIHRRELERRLRELM